MRDLKRTAATNRRTDNVAATKLVLCLMGVWGLGFPGSATPAQQVGVDVGSAAPAVERGPMKIRESTVGGPDDQISGQEGAGDGTPLQRRGAITFDTGEDRTPSAVIDPAGHFAYFGTLSGPGRVVKIDLDTFERVGAITLPTGIGENFLKSAVIDPSGDFAYFGTFTHPGRVVKIDLDTFERVDAVSLDSGEGPLQSAVIDPAGDFAYFGTWTNPGQVVKIDLDTFELVDAITLDSGENQLVSAVIDPAGQFAYFGAQSGPGRVVKIDLDTFERVGAVTLSGEVANPISAVIDPAGQFAYFSTDDTPLGDVVKIDLDTFEQVDTITLDNGETQLVSAVIDPAGQFAYFGTDTSPGRVVKIDLDTFERVDGVAVGSDEDQLRSAVIDPAGEFVYFGTSNVPGRVVKVGQALSLPAALVVDPRPLASNGNGVFEPDETVEMAPSWHNVTDELAVADGILSSFLGPLGALYDIDIDGVEYVIPAGESSSCQDSEGGCYELGIQIIFDRPAPHWDATTVEELTIGPSDTLQQTWSLHIGDSFADVPRPHLFYTAVETLLHNGVTGGCGDGSEYCPGDANTRSQMPAFMLRALMGPDYTPPACDEVEERLFDDVPASNLFCPWIEDLATRSIVSGCGDGDYCPSTPVSRAQMAIFLLKTLEGGEYTPTECSGQFDDVPCPSLFADWIEDLAGRGITSGCTETDYCPSDAVTRGQMAAFITNTFGFTLYGP